MNIGERVLNAVDPERAIASLDDRDLVALVDELAARTWWNEFWLQIATLCAEEAVDRFCRLFHTPPSHNSTT